MVMGPVVLAPAAVALMLVLALAPPKNLAAAAVAAHRPHHSRDVAVACARAAFVAPPPRPSSPSQPRRKLPSRCGFQSSLPTAGSLIGGGGDRRGLPQLRGWLFPRGHRSRPLPTVTLMRATTTTDGGIPLKEEEEEEDRDDSAGRDAGSESSRVAEPGEEDSAAAAPFRFPGKHKWLGGAVDVDGDGSIYGIPSHSGSVLRITPLGGKGGGNVGGDIGAGKEGVDRVVPPVQISTIPLPSTLRRGRFKWLRGIVAGGHLYGIPSWCRHGVLKLRLSPSRSSEGGGGSHGDGDDAVEILPLPSMSAEEARGGDDGRNTARDGGIGAVDTGRWMWHGAALNSDHSAIYCIPANAERVLKVCLETDSVSWIGPPLFPGLKNKWYGGIRGADGAVYGIPYAAGGVLRIDPRTPDDDGGVSILGDFGTGKYNWHGGVFVPANGCIYAFPSHSDKVLRIDTTPRDDEGGGDDAGRLSLLDIRRGPGDARSITRYKWLGGCLGADGCVYGMPSDATAVLRIDPTTDVATTFGGGRVGGGGSGGGGIISSEKNKWQGGVLSPADGCVYAVPSDARGVLRIDTNDRDGGAERRRGDEDEDEHEDDESWRLSVIGGDLGDLKDKWQGGFPGGDGVIYGVPENAGGILRVFPAGGDGDGDGDGPRVDEIGVE